LGPPTASVDATPAFCREFLAGLVRTVNPLAVETK
jgi:hypothetical protein